MFLVYKVVTVQCYNNYFQLSSRKMNIILEQEEDAALWEAAVRGDIELVRLLLDKGSHVDSPKNTFNHDIKITPLYFAASEGNLELVKLLLDRGAQVNIPVFDANPLSGAARNNHAAVVEVLLEVGAIVDFGRPSMSIMRHVAHNGHTQIMKLLLASGGDVDEVEVYSKATPLKIASQKGDLEMVKVLLEGRACADMDYGNLTPLNIAAGLGFTEVVKTLLDHGASVDQATLSHCTPLHAASREGHLEVVKLLLDRGANITTVACDGTPLAVAARNGHFPIVKYLLERGTAIDVATETALSPLAAAASTGNLDMVKLLLEAGACVNFFDSPLREAASNGHYEVAKYLLDNGAAVDTPDFTPLLLAAKHGHEGVVKLLLGSGADTNISDTDGRTPLICASEGHIDVVELLLESGARIESEAVRVAANSGHLDILKLLLETGVSEKLQVDLLEIAAANGHTEMTKFLLGRGGYNKVPSLLTACEKGHTEVVKLLVGNGVAVDSTNGCGESGLHIAASYNHPDVVKVLLASGARVNLQDIFEGTPLEKAVHSMALEVMVLLIPVAAQFGDSSGLAAAFETCLSSGNHDICALIAQCRPKFATEQPQAILQIAKEKSSKSGEIMKQFIDCGADLNYLGGYPVRTALHVAVMKKQLYKIWQLALHGADTSIPFDTQTVWELCDDDEEIHEALLHFWSPSTHKLHPVWVREAIVCTLLVAKQQYWPLDRFLLYKILPYIAYGWYTKP